MSHPDLNGRSDARGRHGLRCAAVGAVNFYHLAPLIGRPWFAEAPQIPQFIYHAFFYGTVLTIPFVALVRKHDQV